MTTLSYPSDRFPAPPSVSLDIPDDWEPVAVPAVVLAAKQSGEQQIFTANVIVRLVLLAIGALRPDSLTTALRTPSSPPTQPADRLKGGRLLGPMERLVILGLGVAGELGAAGLVIAAKGLLRFPEIQAAARGSGPYAAGPATFAGGPEPCGRLIVKVWIVRRPSSLDSV